jgi:hypothetical protein
MTGGSNIPPLEATASTPAAKAGLKPVFFIRGMVTAPVIIMLATGEPVMLPTRALDATDVWAGPPLIFRPTHMPTMVKKSLALVISNTVPNRINRKMMFADRKISPPKIPSFKLIPNQDMSLPKGTGR